MSYRRLVIDGHVHIYSCYDLDKFFDCTIKNMDALYYSMYPDNSRFHRILLFTEGGKNDYFSRFKENGSPGKGSRYVFRDTMEHCSLVLMKDDQPLCYIIKGRQIITREGLEILSIASIQSIKDGLPVDDVIQLLLGNKEIGILTWGVGKWFFKRGKIIKDIIERYHSPYLFIGDNSARPSLWQPELYKLAERNGIRITGGSDPFPFSEEIERVGTYGFLIEGDFQVNKPAESFCNILTSSKSNIELAGYQDSIILFIKRQIRILYRKYIIAL